MPARRDQLPELSPANTRSSMSSIPMAELEPSPVDETPPELLDDPEHDPSNPSDLDSEKHASYFPPSSRSTTNSIGLQRNRIPHILLAIQKYATIPPTLFLLMHYTNTSLVPLSTLSISKAESSLLLTRPYYQSFPIEPLLIFLPIATHAIAGISLRLYRRRQAALRYGAETHAERVKISRSLWPKLSLTSALGYILYPLLVSHVIVNRITPKNVQGDSSGVGFRFFSYGIAKHPWLANVGYAFMISVASWHFVGGAAKYLKLTAEYVTLRGDEGAEMKNRRHWVVNGLSALVAGVWIAGGLGVIGRGIGGPAPSAWEVASWEQVYKNVPVVGRWM